MDPRLFTDNQNDEPLPPLYKGGTRMLFPGQLNKRGKGGQIRGTGNQGSGSEHFRFKSGLRRYVFRYEKDRFVYLATRYGQRNGGFNISPNSTSVTFTYTSNDPTVTGTNTFALSTNSTSQIYHESNTSRIVYDTINTRWEWLRREALSAAFVPQAYSASTAAALRNCSTSNGISWTFVKNPFTTATPLVPITVDISGLNYYNNNSLDKLNAWPIKNSNADRQSRDLANPSGLRKWMQRDAANNFIPDNRPDCITDEILFKCFKGVKLKPYDTVFIEVMWQFRMNKMHTTTAGSIIGNIAGIPACCFGWYPIFHDIEWWSPRPFYGKTQKGRIYRIGILEKDTGEGGFDKVLWCQRTKIITTKWTRGGRTVLE